MKKVVLAITIALFGITAVGAVPTDSYTALAQKKGDDKKKDPPGPPIVKDKGQEKPKEPPRGKKPE